MPTKDQSIRYARWCAERVQVYAVHACADAVTHAAGHAASASAAAAYAADTADTARDYSNSHERAAQANYIRQNFTCPMKGK